MPPTTDLQGPRARSSCSFLVALLTTVNVLASCARDTSDGSGQHAGRCSLDDELTLSTIPGLERIVADVTGDGKDDFLLKSDTSIDVMAGPLPGTKHFSFATDAAFFMTATTGDLDGDGIADLVLSTPWTSEVAVLFAPLAAGSSASMSDAPLVIINRSNGLSNRFGLSVHVDDVTGDGTMDLIVGAAAEGEEGCFGTEDTVIFEGPLAPGRLTDEDAGIRIPAATAGCLGSPILTSVALGSDSQPSLLLGGARQAVWFDAPLGEAPVEAGRTAGGYLAAAKDLDGDGLTDFIFQSYVRYADGRDMALQYIEGTYTVTYEAVHWSADGPDIVLGTVSGNPDLVTYRLLVDGEDDPRKLPVLGTAAGLSMGIWTSAGDIDGDGLTDLAIGEHLIRCAEP